jgi:hypothetical protein
LGAADGQALPDIYLFLLQDDTPVRAPGDVRSEAMVVGIAAMMFVWLFGWGQEYFHWSDPSGKIQLCLFASFVLGIICGYKTKQ